MADKDIVSQVYLSDNERFADIVNVMAFGGKRVIVSESLNELPETARTVFRRFRRRSAMQRHRDLVKKATLGMNYVILGLEEQSDIHYTMPVRVMGYDFIGYEEQIQKTKKIHKKRKDLKGAEYIVGFSKKDRLKPTLTLTLYYGMEPWDGPTRLSQMLDWKDIPEEVKNKIADYPIYVLDVRRFKDSEKLQTDARIVFGFLKRQNDSEELKRYIDKNKVDFSNMEEDAYDMISVMANAPELCESKEKCKSGEGEIDMCEALRQWREEDKAAGRLEGRLEGAERVNELNQYLIKDGRIEDLKESVGNVKYQERLMKEYKL